MEDVIFKLIGQEEVGTWLCTVLMDRRRKLKVSKGAKEGDSVYYILELGQYSFSLVFKKFSPIRIRKIAYEAQFQLNWFLGVF